MPIIPKGFLEAFSIKAMAQGKLYRTGLAPDFTLIATGIGPAFAGDAVLYLLETQCRNIILFGSCGLVKEKKGLSIGSLVTPVRCDDFGSFSDMLADSQKPVNLFFPNNDLIGRFLSVCKKQEISPVRCCSVSSLKLEEERTGCFLRNGIEVVDMECAAIFAAAAYAGLRAIALFYISDIISKKPFYATLEPALQSKLSFSIRIAGSIICEFIKKRLRN